MGVEMHAVDAADLERHVLPDNGVNGMAVGHHRKLLPEIPVMGLLGRRFGPARHLLCDRASKTHSAASRPSPRTLAGGRSHPEPSNPTQGVAIEHYRH